MLERRSDIWRVGLFVRITFLLAVVLLGMHSLLGIHTPCIEPSAQLDIAG